MTDIRIMLHVTAGAEAAIEVAVQLLPLIVAGIAVLLSRRAGRRSPPPPPRVESIPFLKRKRDSAMTSQSPRPASGRSRRLNRASPPPKPSRRTPIVFGLSLAAAAVIVAGLILLMRMAGSDDAEVLTGVESFTITERNHVQVPVTYQQTPPVGGNHAPVWQNCGSYDAPISSEQAVHSMEHGAVWVTYRPDLDSGQGEALRQLARRQTFIISSPFPGLPAPVVASAWGRQLRLESADDPRLQQFLRRFRIGPQTPEPGAPCTGGRGTPK